MKFLQDPVKAKRIFIPLVLLCSIFLISSIVLSLLYLRTNNEIDSKKEEVKSLEDDKKELEEEIESLETNIKELEDVAEIKDEYEKEISQLEGQIENYISEEASYKNKLSKINLYNIVHHYIYDLVIAHSDGTPITEAEYQTTRAKAEATGDTTLVSAVDNAWYNRDGQPAVRFGGMMWEIVDGIYSQTK